MMADPKRENIKELNMVDPDEEDSNGRPMPARALHIIDPDKVVKLSFLYPATTGRKMDEVIRVLDSPQRAAKHKVATPADWKPGDKVVISSDEEAKKMLPQGFETAKLPSGKGYLRFTHVD
ncbi:1-Cys peroxiredoxin PER1-like protein [Drosera capensis]